MPVSWCAAPVSRLLIFANHVRYGDLNAPFIVLRCASDSCPVFNTINGVRSYHIPLTRRTAHPLHLRDDNAPCARVLDGQPFCMGASQCTGHVYHKETQEVSNIVLILTLSYMKNNEVGRERGTCGVRSYARARAMYETTRGAVARSVAILSSTDHDATTLMPPGLHDAVSTPPLIFSTGFTSPKVSKRPATFSALRCVPITVNCTCTTGSIGVRKCTYTTQPKMLSRHFSSTPKPLPARVFHLAVHPLSVNYMLPLCVFGPSCCPVGMPLVRLERQWLRFRASSGAA